MQREEGCISLKPYAPLTCCQLHPGTDFVDRGCIAEEEEAEAEDAADDEESGDAHKEHGCLEGTRGDGAKVQGATLADELAGESVADAVGEEAEVAGLRGVNAVADPVGLDEGHHHDDGEAEGEEHPQHPHGTCVAHVVGVVDLGGLLRRQQLGHGAAGGDWSRVGGPAWLACGSRGSAGGWGRACGGAGGCGCLSPWLRGQHQGSRPAPPRPSRLLPRPPLRRPSAPRTAPAGRSRSRVAAAGAEESPGQVRPRSQQRIPTGVGGASWPSREGVLRGGGRIQILSWSKAA